MQTLNEFYYSWGPAVADFNHDGAPDIVAGPYYYLGPEYKESREIYLAATIDPGTQYFNGLQYAYDFTGDGWPDVLNSIFNRPAVLYVNPKGESRRWDTYTVYRQDDVRVHAAEGRRRRRHAGVSVQGQREPVRVCQAGPRESDRHVDEARHQRKRSVGEPRHGRRRCQQRRAYGFPERVRLVGAACEGSSLRAPGRTIRRRSAAGPARARAERRWPCTT